MHHIWESFQQNEHLVPDLIISSTAKRAYSTAKAVAKAAAYGDIALNQSLYAAPPTAYIDVLRNLSNEYTRVLMVGHNSGLEQLVNMLSGEENVMPTCSLVHVQWTEINYKTKGKLLRMWNPRDLI